MKKYSLIFTFTSIIIKLTAQSWIQPHSSIILPNIPATSKLENLISVNGSTAIGSNSVPAPGVIKNMRNFHQMEIDYKYGYFPYEGIPNPDTCDCTNAWCNNSITCSDFIIPGTKSGFESLKDHYCHWKANTYGFSNIHAALESIFPKANWSSACGNTTINRGYPNKWYSLTEWGGLGGIKNNFRDYTTAFIKTFCPKDGSKSCLVDVLEVGNEPWGDPYPGQAGYHLMLQGAVEAMRNYYGTNNPDLWRMQLSLAAFQAHDSDAGPFGEQWYYVDKMIPDSLKQYFSQISIHNYAFTSTNPSSGPVERPESTNGGFLTVKNLIEWRNQKMPKANVNMTEFGWNAGTQGAGCSDLGESTQASYLMRAYLLAARYNVMKAYVYGYTDSNEFPFYCATGLYKDLANNIPRKQFRCIQKIMTSTLKDKVFLKALEEIPDQPNKGMKGKYIYLFGDSATGKPTHIVGWRPDSLGFEDTNYPNISSAYDSIQLPSLTMSFNSGDAYYYLGWDNSQDNTINGLNSNVMIKSTSSDFAMVKLSAMPIVIPIHAGTCQYDLNGNLINCNSVTAINYLENNYKLNIFYSNGNIYINTGVYNGNAIVKIFNTLGEEVFEKLITSSFSTQQITFENKEKGIYIIKTELTNEQCIVKKIAVN